MFSLKGVFGIKQHAIDVINKVMSVILHLMQDLINFGMKILNRVQNDILFERHQLLTTGRMNGNHAIKIGFGGTHADGDGKALQHFITA